MSNKNKIWSTKRVEDTRKAIEEGRVADTSCFWSQDIDYRAANINFELTQEEAKEFIKCSKDIVYFANKYAYAMTDDGIANISLRDYQKRMLTEVTDPVKRFHIVLASRQVGKCPFFNTKIKVKNLKTNIIQEIEMFKFRHILMKPIIRKLPFKDRLIYKTKYNLYRLYNLLD